MVDGDSKGIDGVAKEILSLRQADIDRSANGHLVKVSLLCMATVDIWSDNVLSVGLKIFFRQEIGHGLDKNVSERVVLSCIKVGYGLTVRLIVLVVPYALPQAKVTFRSPEERSGERVKVLTSTLRSGRI